MANIIDSLVVTLGLDTKGFQQGAKQTEAQVDKMRKDSERTAKQMEAAGKRAASFFDQVTNSALKLGAVLLGGIGLKEFAVNTLRTDAAVGRLAVNLGLSTKELSSWEGAAKIAGGSADGIDSALKTLSESIQTLRLTGQIEGPLKFFSQLGIALNDANGNVRPITDMMLDISKLLATRPPAEATSISKMLGFDEGTGNFLKQGPAAIRALLVEQEKLGTITEKDSAAAQQLIADFDRLKQSSETLGRTLLTALAPALDTVLKSLTGLAKQAVANPDVSTPIVGAGVAGVAAMAASKLGILKYLVNPATAAIFGLTYSSGLNEGEDAELAKIRGDGASPGAAGNPNAPRSLRNNNPGNIEYGTFAKAHGATGSDGRFAVFPTLESGRQAQISLLNNYLTSKSDKRDTISGIVSKWAPAKDGNDTSAYIASVAKKTGIDPNASLSASQLPAIADAMSGVEAGNSKYAQSILSGLNGGGGRASGGSTTEVNINSMVINTKATDANGMAKDVKNAFTTTGIVAQSNTGLTQ